MSGALRVCLPLEGMTPSGGLRMLVTLANGLAARGHAVTVVVPDYAARSPWPLDDAVTLRVVRTRGGRMARRIGYLTHLARHAARGFDAVYATGYKTPWLLTVARRAAGARRRPPTLLYFLQGHDAVTATAGSAPRLRRLLRAVGERGYRLPLVPVAVSRWVAQQVGRPDAHVVPNGVDPSVFHPPRAPRPVTERADDLTVAVLGSAAPNKGYAVFVDALGRLPESIRARLRVRVAGFAPVPLPDGVRAEWVATASDAEIAAFYGAADVFVFPSFRDGFGLPVLEAMACGTPVVATRCGGVEEFATPSNAVLVPVGDPAALAGSLGALLADPERRARLRAAGLETARGLTIERACDAHAAVLEAACAQR